MVYSKRPFGGPKEVLRYLARYTHRVAISNRRLIALDDKNVTFKWKDYRIEGRERYKVMTLAINEFIRRFLIHSLPSGFHGAASENLHKSGPRCRGNERTIGGSNQTDRALNLGPCDRLFPTTGFPYA